MRQKFSRWLSLLTVCFMLAVYCTPSQAALQAVGPTDVITTIPAFYQDLTGLALVPCLDQTANCILAPPFAGGVAAITTTGPISNINFPSEAFYYWADAALIPIEGGAGQPAGDRLRLTYVLEYAFLQGVAPNAAITFLRTDIQKMNNLAPNSTYRVTHPYGVLTFATDALGNTAAGGGVAIRQEDPFGSPLLWLPPQMKSAAFTNIGPFLTRPGGLLIVGVNKYIGDAVTYAPVTGGPNGNIVKVERLTALGVPVGPLATWQTANFALAGKVFTGQIPSPLTIDSTTYARDAATGQVDVFVTALPAAIPAISGTGLPVSPLNLTPDIAAIGKFFAHISLPTSTLPTAINITNSLDAPAINHPVTLVDEVNITQARYNPISHDLTIMAASRDKLTPPTLTAFDTTGLAPINLGALVAGTLVKNYLNSIPPLTVTVSSSLGGKATAPVSVVTPPAAPVALDDITTTVGTTPVVIDVLFNDTPAVNIDPTTVQPANAVNGIAVKNLNGTVTFTPAVAAVYPVTASFTYTVSDTFGQVSNVATVTVTVTAPAAPLPPAVQTPPVAIADTAKTTPGTAVTFNVVANDTIALPGVINPITIFPIQTVAQLLNGTAVANINGTVTFTPAVGFTGAATFTYTVSDSSTPALVSNQALITVTVAANIPPVANNDVASTFVGVARIINVKANDTDADGTIALGAVTPVILPASGTVVANQDGTVTFAPNLVGTHTFTYHVFDNLNTVSNDATVTVSVLPPVTAITDSVTVLRAQYTANTGTWLVEGTTTNLTTPSRIVTIYLGKDLTGQTIGTTVDAAGKWKFNFSFGAGILAPALLDRTISVALPSGASRLAFPVAVK